MQYDYIGAPWYVQEEFWFTELNMSRSLQGQRIVGNGGFCLRSKNFLEASSDLAAKGVFTEYQPEDVRLCVYEKKYLLERGMRFAPPELAQRFSIEGQDDIYSDQFGFHGFDWTDITKWIAENPQWEIEQVLKE